jgi:ribose 5-phosphate isomerase A
MKKAAAIEALKFVKPGMKIGLGTGSTANHFIEALAARVKEGLDILGVPTSRASKDLAEKHGITLTNLDAQARIDLTVDGADEFDAEFRLIKGGGGALLFEKIVASSSRLMVVIADESKKVKSSASFPFLLRSTALAPRPPPGKSSGPSRI